MSCEEVARAAHRVVWIRDLRCRRTRWASQLSVNCLVRSIAIGYRRAWAAVAVSMPQAPTGASTIRVGAGTAAGTTRARTRVAAVPAALLARTAELFAAAAMMTPAATAGAGRHDQHGRDCK